MNKKLKQLLVVLAFTATFNNVAFAQPVSNSSNSYSKIQELERNIENLDNQIEGIMSKIADNKKQIQVKEKDIENSEKELKTAESDMNKQKELFKSRMRALYINGSSGYLGMLLDSNGLGDFISRADTVSRIISFDTKVISKYKTKQKEIADKVDKLKTENKNLLALKSENENKLNELNKNKNDQKKLIDQAKQDQRQYASAEQASVSAAANQVASIRSAAPKITLSRGSSPISSDNVVAYASNFLGTPYLWGGTTPNGFDCSGFTQYVYRHFGISVGRTTYDQIKDGVAVSRDQLQPGDLVFYGKGGNPTHMGIYVGNGAYIHAPRTGDVVKISPVDRGDYITARRVK
ncbi:NlpC/P60 family protein [Clostridium magnum]|uniref:Murein DD-endopeptidase MepH n=1 Tax=Clostridium magnum DSM 2767 TaxID=1121326 RepID=A0A161WFN5_9CLOT|nr:C40 family peptidase [Clostridium magnum]KZL90485.1 murein DD-endopeptidase MepH precursor [Clostridium magnum DSM 2767]SHH86436.1 Cell wall-associated hydrolase, NlpC family [Clostridium magnum DSM 2767]